MTGYCKEVTENEDKDRVSNSVSINQKATKKSEIKKKEKERNWIEKRQGNGFCWKNKYRFVRFTVGNTKLGWCNYCMF